MTDDEREVVRQVASEACDAFMRRLGAKYPWLHPDYDPECPGWLARCREARRRIDREQPRRRHERIVL